MRRDLNADGDAAITVVPRYGPEQLPALLGDATVGLFPSYIEGFGFAVLEKLAAGVPVVAYDVPGVRETRPARGSLTARAGGRHQGARGRAAAIMRLPSLAYSDLSARCLAVADGFRWTDIAQRTAAAYAERMR